MDVKKEMPTFLRWLTPEELKELCQEPYPQKASCYPFVLVESHYGRGPWLLIGVKTPYPREVERWLRKWASERESSLRVVAFPEDAFPEALAYGRRIAQGRWGCFLQDPTLFTE